MKTNLFRSSAAAAVLFGATALLPANATTITVEAGGIVLNSTDITTVGSLADPWLITETMTSPGTLEFAEGPLGGDNDTGSTVHSTGKWFAKTILNDTGITWTSFELELQIALGVPSLDGDGLSFAQGAGFIFSSDQFSTYSAIEDIRDYLNFSTGEVLDGETVTFLFAITDNSNNDPFWLLQTPNIRDVPVGVPEPGTLALLASGLGGLALLRRRRSVKNSNISAQAISPFQKV